MDLFTALTKLTPLDELAWLAMQQVLCRRTLPRGAILTNEGQFNEEVYFIESGLVRAFYVKDSHEVTTWMAAEGRFIWPLPSYLLHRPSPETVQLLEPSVIVAVSRRDMAALQQQYSVFVDLQYRLMERYIIMYDLRVQLLLIPKAEDRLTAFGRSFPDLAQRAPLRHIASFLGIDPSTLSRMRGQYQKKKKK